jgi:hypothetical protein
MVLRGDFLKNCLALSVVAAGVASAVFASPGGTEEAAQSSSGLSPNFPALTQHVAEFIANSRFEDIPESVLTLGEKSTLDGFGLALGVSNSIMAPLVRKYIQSLGGRRRKGQSHWLRNQSANTLRRVRQWNLYPCR